MARDMHMHADPRGIATRGKSAIRDELPRYVAATPGCGFERWLRTVL